MSSFVTYQSCPLEHWFSLPDSGKPPTTLPSLSSHILSLATTSCSHWLSHPSPSETTMYISTPCLLHLLSRSLPLDFIGPLNVHQLFLVDRALRHHHVFYKMRYFLIFLSRFLSSLQELLINTAVVTDNILLEVVTYSIVSCSRYLLVLLTPWMC